MKILYIHGFGSKFDPTSEKIVKLSTIGTVAGPDLDYAGKTYQVLLTELINFALEFDPDIIIGTSMGGYMAAALQNAFQNSIILQQWRDDGNIPKPGMFINPCLDPGQQLRKYLGAGVDYDDNEYFLEQSTLDSYPIGPNPFPVTGVQGVVVLDLADEVIDAQETFATLSSYFPCLTFNGGSHRFEHMDEILPLVKSLEV